MSTWSRLVLVGVCVAALATAALADDLLPPSWRGQPGSTVQEWEFLQAGPNYGEPDGALYNNPYGPPVAYDDPGGTSAIWRETFAGRTGVLEFVGPYALVFDVPNDPEPNDEKWIQIQTTFYSPQGYPVEQGPSGTIITWDDGLYNSDTTVTPQSWIDLSDGWYVHIFDVVLPENPDFERVEVFWNSGVFEPYYVDQVVIDTICIPEPLTLGLLAVGGLALLRRRH